MRTYVKHHSRHKLSGSVIETIWDMFLKRKLLVISFLILLTVLPIAIMTFQYVNKSEAAWYNASWLHRKELTFNNSAQSSNLVNFPVLVVLNETNFNFAEAKANGEDLRFTDTDGSTLLSYEIEIYDSIGKSARIWVNVPQINASSSTDFIYMYWGNSAATDAQSIDNTWNSNYKGVYHLGDNAATTTVTDSSGLTNNLIANTNTNSEYSSLGKIGSGFLTMGSPHRIPNIGSQNNEQYQDFVLDSNNFPVIAYWEATTLDLIIVHCNDRDCKGDDESVTAPDTVNATGYYPSIKLDTNGYPIIAYYDATNTNLNLMHCNDVNCAGGNESISAVDTTGNIGYYPDLQIDGNGYPVVAYYDLTNTNLKLVHCNDINCTGGNESIVTLDGAAITAGGYHRSISLDLNSVGYPVVSFYDATNADLRLLVCNDINCTGGDDLPTSIQTTNDVGRYSKIILDGSDYPMVVFEDWTGRDAYFLHCNDTLCAGGNDTPVLIENTTADYPSFTLDNSGNPIITYQLTSIYPVIAVCSDATCATTSKTTLAQYNQYNFLFPNVQVASDNSIVLLGQSLGREGSSDLNLFTTTHKLERSYDSDFDFGTGSFSISAWFKAKYIDQTKQNTILSRYDTDQGYKLYMNYGGYPCFGIDDDATWGPDDSACTSQTNYTPDVDNGQALSATEHEMRLDASGYPMIVYYDGSTDLNLEYIHCNDLYCAGGDETKITLDATGNVGNQPSMVLDSNGFPVVSYYDTTNTDLKLVHCGNVDCSAGNVVSAVDTTANIVGTQSSLQLDGNGYPVITYFDTTNGDLKFVHCNDVNCAGGDDGPIALYSTNTAGNFSSLQLDGNGYPVIAFLYNNANDLYFIHCNDVNCAGGDDLPTTLDTTGTTGYWPSMQLDSNGYPVIAYSNQSDSLLKLIHCNDVNCTGANESITTVFNGYSSGYNNITMLLNGAGNPVILHTSLSNWSQVLTTCNDPNCSGNNETNTMLRQNPYNYIYGSLALDGSGYPIVSVTVGDVGLYRPNAINYSNLNTKDDGEWHHVVGVKNGTSSITLYLDGVAVATDSSILATGTLTSNSSSLNLGEDILNGMSTYGWGGWLDEVQIDSTARTSDWIAAQYLSESNSFINVGNTQNRETTVKLGTFTNNTGAIKNNLTGYWKFDEGYGTVANNSGYGGQILNGNITNASWTSEGKFSKTLNYDGTGDYTTVPNNAALNFGSNSFSVSYWLNFNPGSSQQRWTMGKGNPYQSSGAGWAIANWTTGNPITSTLYVSDGTGAPASHTVNFPSVSRGTWRQHTFVVDRAANLVKTYSNGVYYGQLDISSLGSFDSSNDLLIGTGNGTGNTSDIKIDEVKIYNAALTAEEVKQDFNKRSSLSFGSLSDTSALSGGSIASNSASAQYCIPGDSSPCNPPVGEWNFEEAAYTNNCSTATVFDTSTNGLNLLSCPNGTGPTSKGAGKLGSAIYLDGVNDELNSTSTNFDLTGEITTQAWVKVTDITNASDPEILNKSNNNAGYALEIGFSSRNPKFRIGNGTTYSVLSGTSVLQNNVWYFVTGTLSATGVQKIYVNGRQENSTTITGSLAAAVGQTFRLGVRGAGTYLNGAIDQVRIYNYARTPAQISWDYNQGKPIGHWKLDECQGAIANDSSGNNNIGTVTIGATGTNASTGTCTSSGAWADGASGRFNSSLELDGTDDEITTADSPSLDMANMTVSAWIKTSNAAEQCIVERNNSTFYFCTSGGKLRYWINGVAATWMTSNKSVNDGAWHHVLGTWDGADKKLYIDGLLDKTEAGSGGDIGNTTVGLNFGVRKNAGVPQNYFNGQIDEVKLYNYAQTASQVKQQYNGGSAIRFGQF
ncbi:MAG: DUF2341 domain-containing protein [Microgenomates group bacterium]